MAEKGSVDPLARRACDARSGPAPVPMIRPPWARHLVVWMTTWMAQDPCPTYSRLDRMDGLGRSTNP